VGFWVFEEGLTVTNQEREAKPALYKCGRCGIEIPKRTASETFERLGIALCKPCEDATAERSKAKPRGPKSRQRKMVCKDVASIIDVMMFAKELKYLVEQRFKVHIEYEPEPNEEWRPELLGRIIRR
jgi:hypothetical protein